MKAVQSEQGAVRISPDGPCQETLNILFTVAVAASDSDRPLGSWEQPAVLRYGLRSSSLPWVIPWKSLYSHLRTYLAEVCIQMVIQLSNSECVFWTRCASWSGQSLLLRITVAELCADGRMLRIGKVIHTIKNVKANPGAGLKTAFEVVLRSCKAHHELAC